MLKFKLVVFAVLFLAGIHFSSAQITILNQTMLTDASFNTFTPVSVTGEQGWYQHDVYGAVCSGYNGQSFENEDWLISPAMNLLQMDNVKLTFSHTRGNAAVMNVGVTEGWYKVFATASYTGNPATTQWIELTGLNQNLPAAWQYVPSGDLVIPDAAKSAGSRIAFRYISSAAQSATWEIRNVQVTGAPQSTNPASGVFKITNWNVEWLGCTQFGPVDEALQFSNVTSAMLAMNSDVYCLQEVTDAQATLASLLSLMGDGWSGHVVPATSDLCGQRQAVVYKTSRVQLSGAELLSIGQESQGNSYYYNWSNGRFPALYEVSLIAGGNMVPVSLVNLHAKAEDGNPMSYLRRLGGSEGLKTILDGPAYNAKNLIVIGDFNDYLSGTTSTACDCTDSPYKNFVDDYFNYTGVTGDLTDAIYSRPLIEHFIISDELIGNYLENSAMQETAVAQSIPFFYGTTSHHLPVTATFSFPVLGVQEVTQNTLKLYPNPAKNRLMFDSAENADVTVYDLTGRPVHCPKATSDAIDVSGLPSGIYILKAGDRIGRFVRE